MLAQRTVIESELGKEPTWDANPEAMDKTIATYHDANLKRRDKWPEYLDWMVGTIADFRRTFSPRVKAIDLDLVLEDLDDDSEESTTSINQA